MKLRPRVEQYRLQKRCRYGDRARQTDSGIAELCSGHRVVVSGERRVTGRLVHPGEPLTTSAGKRSGIIIWSQPEIINWIIRNHPDQKLPSGSETKIAIKYLKIILIGLNECLLRDSEQEVDEVAEEDLQQGSVEMVFQDGPRKAPFCCSWLLVLCLVLENVGPSSSVRMSGVYVDNGFDQTVVHRVASPRDKRNVENEILNLLGLPDRPRKTIHRPPQVKRSAPKFLLDIYKNALGEEDEKPVDVKHGKSGEFDLSGQDLRAIDQSDVIMTFAAHSKRFHISFLIFSFFPLLIAFFIKVKLEGV